MAASTPSENLRSRNPSLNTTSGITRRRSNRIANIPVNENPAIIEPPRKKRKTGPEDLTKESIENVWDKSDQEIISMVPHP